MTNIYSYNEFTQHIKDKHQFPKDIYYSLLVLYKEQILLDVARTSQGVVASKLDMNHTPFSSVLNILKLDIQLTDNGSENLREYLNKRKSGCNA